MRGSGLISKSVRLPLGSPTPWIVLGVATLTALGLASPSVPASANTPTTLFSLGTLGGYSSQSNAINASGQVVGWSDTLQHDSLGEPESGAGHAFYWDQAHSMIDLDPTDWTSGADGINNNDQVVGSAAAENVAGDVHAVLWDVTNPLSPVMRDLSPMLGTGVFRSEATAINDNGLVVGYTEDANGHQTPFAWDPTDGYSALPVTAGGNNSCLPHAVNDNGVIVGECNNDAVMWDSDHNLTIINPPDFDSANHDSAEAYGINASGEIVGLLDIYTRQSTEGYITGVLVRNPDGSFQDPSAVDPALRSVQDINVYGVNDLGQIVGYYATPLDTCGPFHAFVIDPDPNIGFVDVGTDGIVSHGQAINDAGQVVGAINPYYCSTVAPPLGTAFTALSGRAPSAANNTGIERAAAWGAKLTPPTVAVGDASIVAGTVSKSRTLQFPVTLSIPSATQVSVSYAISANEGTATPGIDFRTKTGTVVFKPSPKTGRTATTLWVSASIPSTTTTTKFFTVQISHLVTLANYGVSRSIGTGTIVGASTDPGLWGSIGDSAVSEGDHGKNGVKLWLDLSAPAPFPVTVQVTIGGGTALAGTDYKTFKTKTLTFKTGQFQKAITVTTYTNMLTEQDETADVTLSNPSAGLELGKAVGVVTILNDD